MKEIKNKTYETKGLLMVKNRIFPDVPFSVMVTNDNIGCTVTIGCEAADISFAISFDKMLKDLEG